MSSSIGQSPIAEDGGFGPMDYESSKGTDEEVMDDSEFNDFENGAEKDDFGDFDDFEQGFEAAEDVENVQVPMVAPGSVIELVPFVSSSIASLAIRS